MFILDTNILSAMMSTQAVPQVAAWIAGQPTDLLFTTSVSQAEILSGLAIMAEGRRRLDLEAAGVLPFFSTYLAHAQHASGLMARPAERPENRTTSEVMFYSQPRKRG